MLTLSSRRRFVQTARVPAGIRTLWSFLRPPFAATSALEAATVTAMWNPNSESDLAGYRLSYGTQSGAYTTTVDVGNVTSWPLSLAAGQRYYFVVSAYNASGGTSPYSSEGFFDVPAPTAPTNGSLSPPIGPPGPIVSICASEFRSSPALSPARLH